MQALLTTQTDIIQKEIAQKIGVSPSTVSRELRRNLQSERNEYQAGIAHQLHNHHLILDSEWQHKPQIVDDRLILVSLYLYSKSDGISTYFGETLLAVSRGELPVKLQNEGYTNCQ
jgi:DNA-binding transcriptional ArsR family regulator